MSHSHKLLCTLVAGLAFAVAAPGSASAYTFLQTPDGVPLRWQQSPVPYMIGPLSDDLPEDQQMDAIFAAFDAWEQVPGVEMQFEFVGTTDLATVGNDGTNVVFFMKSGWPAGSAAIATTQTFAQTTGEIVGFDLPINDAAYFFTAEDDASKSQTDLQNALTHEVGHILGLDHSLDPEATMYAVTSRGDLEKRSLASDDEQGAQFLYADGVVQADDDPAVMGCGCSTPAGSSRSGASLGFLILGAAVGLGRRRRS